jgi:hypothetical protein
MPGQNLNIHIVKRTRKAFAFSVSLTLALAALTVFLSARHAAAQNRDLFNNFNTAAVSTGPNLPPLFALGAPAQITEVVTYHWNNGRGAIPNAIYLRSSTGQIWQFPARGDSGQNGAPNVSWVAAANVVVPAGYYTVLDSDPNTRSYNAQSGFRHFAIVRGYYVSRPTPPPPPPPAPVSTSTANNRLCANSTYAVATISPCTGPTGTTINVNLQRRLTSPPALLVFKRVLANGVPAQVTAPVISGSGFSALAPPQLCARVAGGQGGGPWQVLLIDAQGRSQGVIGSFWPDCR